MGMHLVCKKCNHEWQYAGDKHRTSCPKCKSSVTVVVVTDSVLTQRMAAEATTLAANIRHEQLVQGNDIKITPASDLFVDKEQPSTAVTGVFYDEPMKIPVFNLYLPLKLLDSLAFSKAKAWAKANGEDDMKLNSNSEGVLSLA